MTFKTKTKTAVREHKKEEWLFRRKYIKIIDNDIFLTALLFISFMA
jgi:hypothetical protein